MSKSSLQSQPQQLPEYDSSEPGPAVGALQKSLTIHCQKEEIRTLQLRAQTGDRICMAQNQLIENLQRELDARLEVIQDLQDHWQRAEETCAARLTVIEQLESHRQRLEAGSCTQPPSMLPAG